MTTNDWAPTLDQVGAYVRARTKDRYGNELGTFTDTTRPTDNQVVELINQSQQDVMSELGVDLDASLNDRARSVAALGAAMLVELSHYPEQVAAGRSPYIQLKEWYDQRLGRLTTAATLIVNSNGDAPNALGPSWSSGNGLDTEPLPVPVSVEPWPKPNERRATAWDMRW